MILRGEIESIIQPYKDVDCDEGVRITLAES